MKRLILIMAGAMALTSRSEAQVVQFLQVFGGAVPIGGVPNAAAATASLPEQKDGEWAGTLRWTNGEEMKGEIVEATGTSATWKTPLFEEPVSLGWDVIHRIDWPARAIPASDPFLFSLRDGSTIFGDLVAVTGSSVFVHGSRYGDAELKRSEVLSARRIKGDSLLMAGPTGDAGWEETRIQQDGSASTRDAGRAKKGGVSGFTGGPGGSLQTPYWNRAALMNLSISDPVDVEFHVHSTGRPNFRFAISEGPGSELRIETWDDALVAVLPDESDFQLIRRIDDTEHDIALRFCWDSKTRHCMVFSPAGELITEWQAPADATDSPPGVMLQNKGSNFSLISGSNVSLTQASDLSLDYLRIRKWDGKPPPKVDPSLPRIELEDGRILAGEVTSGTAGSIQLKESGDEPRSTFALKDVDALLFAPDAPGDSTAQATLAYADGTYLNGQISSIKDGWVTLVTSFMARPLVASMAGMRLLFVNSSPNVAPSQAFAKLDLLKIQRTTLHGALVDAGGASPEWLPAGGLAPVTPSKTIPYEIQRTIPDDAPISAAPALFLTRSGDVLPGNMHALDRSGVEFDAGITQATKLPAADLEAILFGAAGRLNSRGFNDPNWRILKGDDSKIHRDGDSLSMEPGTAIENAAAMQCSEIRFGMQMGMGGLSTVRLRMFCAGSDPTKSSNLLFAVNGNQIICGDEATEGQLGSEIVASPPGGDIEVRVAIQERSVTVYLNGVSVLTVSVPPSARPGSGLIIEPASVWGNSPQPIKISYLSMSSAPGMAWLPDVAPDAKTEALTIPRFSRDDPPSHALIAMNGDILRGEIEAATNENFGFRSGMEELTVPRDRVKAVIWLGKPQAAQASPTVVNPADALLAQRMDMRVNFGAGNTLRGYTGFLEANTPGLKFKLPKEEITETRSMPLGGEALGSVVDKICAAFGLTYQVDEKGVIVLEVAAGEPESGPMIDKVYWLKPESLPNDTPADKVLAGKGIAFPKGATAIWQSEAGQLTVRNTPANQALLAQVLGSDFGGVLGSPTHWLLLANGGRLGLAVDNFGKDAITGWHPLYGRCSIPTVDVAAIRSYPLEPSAAMKSVEDWHTAYAPEPVLPEAGGDSAASVGKPGAEFSLALLDGEKFDLAQQKGKIVVMDFWATWCGPCVRSLPELIQAMSGFSPDHVKFVALDEDEPAALVKQFLETREWKLTVALDDGQHVGQQYGVDGIPHTVVIGPDGKVAWVKTGYTPDGESEVAKEVNLLLGTPASANPAVKPQ